MCKWSRKQAIYLATVSYGCLVAGGIPAAFAAEWSVTPVYSSSADYDSNRFLVTDRRGSGAAVLTADLRFKRALEDSEIAIEPRYTLRRYTDPKLGNGDDRSVSASLDKTTERAVLHVLGSYDDQSTLMSELLETGIVNGDTHRRQTQLGGNWTWSQTERRQLVTQLSYYDVSYYGRDRDRLPGYRYPSASVGERWVVSELASLTVSAFGTELSSDAPGGSNHEYGLQVQFVYVLSELTRFDGSVGRSTRLLSGKSSQGTDFSLSLTRDLTRGSLGVTYSRSLVPYGIGVLAERQQGTAAALYRLTPYLDANLTLLRIANNDTAVKLGLDRRSITSLTAGLTWRPLETWSFGLQVGGVRTQTLTAVGDQPVSGWHSSATLTWTPFPRSRSW